MPLIPDNEGDKRSNPYGIFSPPEEYLGTADPSPSVLDTLGAAFRQENLVGSLAARETGGYSTKDLWRVDPDFNPFDDIEGYEEYADRFEHVFNAEAASVLKSNIDRERTDRDTLARSGWIGIGATFGATLVDPTILIPGGTIYKGAKATGATLKTAASVAAAAGAATALQEVGLQATQETRTVSESALNVGGSVVLGGVLGTAIGVSASRAYKGSDWAKASTSLDNAMAPEFDAATDVLHAELKGIAVEAQAAGAAATPMDSLDDLAIAGRSASVAAKAVYLKKNLEGYGDTAAETAMHEYTRGAVMQAVDAQRKAYSNARRNGLKLTEQQFREAVGYAMRRGDRSDIPGVSEAAKAWRSNVIEPLKDRAIKAGLLPEGVEVITADSYLSRVYNRPLIEANETEFKGILREWLTGEIEKELTRKARSGDAKARNMQAEASDLEMRILRRGEDVKRRAQGDEFQAGDLTEQDALQMINRVRAGDVPKRPETLSGWLRRQKEGAFDPMGELAALGITPKTWPGFIRRQRYASATGKGGLGLDDLARRAWDEGFLEGVERPSIRDFLDALQSDMAGDSIVRAADFEAARLADDFDRVLEALGRAGIDVNAPRFATSDALKDISGKINRVLDDLDRQRIADLNSKADRARAAGAGDFVSDADRLDYIDQIADEIFNRVTGRAHDGSLPADLLKITTRGPLKERVLNIPDQKIEKFLDSDVEMVGRRYARMMASDIELSERFGSPDMESAFIDVADDYKRLRQQIERDKTLSPEKREKAFMRLADRERADVRDLEGVRDMLRGHYRPEIQHTGWARILRAANTFNYIRALGGVLIASLTDAVRPAMVHGLNAYMSDAIGPLIRNSKGYKLAKKEAALAGAVAEKILASRLATLAEITDPYAMRSPFERFLDNAAAGFSKMTGLLHWNDFQKEIASVLTQNRILENAEIAATKGFDAMPKREQAYMGYLGLGRGRAEDLGRVFQEFGEKLEGLRVANSQAWGPEMDYMRRAFRAAINKDVDSIIVTKGAGDVPLSANTPIGRALMQFKSFAMASNQRVLIRGLQEDKSRMVGGVLGMATIGMFIYAMKQLEAGRDISDNPGTWIAEGLDRSGIFSVAFEVNNALEKVGAPGVFTGAAAMFPEADQRQPASRYAVRSSFGAFLGPSFGGATDVVGLMGLGFRNLKAGATGEELDMTQGDIASMRRLTPFASLPYWRWFIDGMMVPELKKSVAE